MEWLWVFLKNWDSEESFDLKAGHWWIMLCDDFAVEWRITLAVIIFAIVQSAGYFKCLTDDLLKGSF